MARRWLTLVAVLAGCADGRSVVVVTLDSDVPVKGVAKIRVAVTNEGLPARPVELKLASGTFDIPPPQRFSLSFDRDRRGSITVAAEAIDGGGSILASASGAGAIEPSHTTEVTVRFGSLSGADMGVDGFVMDMAHADARVLTWKPQASNTANLLTGVWGSGPDDVYVIGNKGTLLHTTDGGSTWNSIDPGTTVDLLGIWGSGRNDIYLVGANGTIRHSVNGGMTWQPQMGPLVALYGVWGSGPGDVYVVGDLGTIAHSANGGASWQNRTTPNMNDLRAVWGSDSTTVYAVGGSILRSADGGMTFVERPLSTGAFGVWGTSATDVYLAASTNGGIIYHTVNGGLNWTTTMVPNTQFMLGVWGTAADNVYAVGDFATIAHSTNAGVDWPIELSNGTPLFGIWGSARDDVYAVGANGVIVHLE